MFFHGYVARLLKPVLFFLSFALSFLWAEFPDTAAARLQTRTLIEGSFDGLSQWPGTVIDTDTAGKVAVGSEVLGQTGVIYYACQSSGKYSDFLPGSTAVFKSKQGGEILRIRIRFNFDKESSIEIVAFGKKAQLSILLFGHELYAGVSLPLPMSEMVYLTFERIRELTAAQIDWNSVLVPEYRSGYAGVENLALAVRPLLPSLQDAEDGAFDENGEAVFIESLSEQDKGAGLNCSGFAKWIVDGILVGSGKPASKIADLKVKYEDLRGSRIDKVFEEKRDPFFGLDWIRNLAVIASGYPTSRKDMIEKYDIRLLPPFEYQEDIGFHIEDMKTIMYLSAVKYPGRLILLSVNRPYGKDPVIQQHHHIAVVMPYFDAQGRFFAVLFERNAETPIDDFIKRYPGAFIHPVLVKAGTSFVPFSVAPAAAVD
jgi:hypothetical protein